MRVEIKKASKGREQHYVLGRKKVDLELTYIWGKG